jgi:hypothetical protein
MGWDSAPHWSSPKDVLEELNRDYADSKWTVLKQVVTARGRRVWSAIRLPNGHGFIQLARIEKAYPGVKDSVWSLRTDDEGVGPSFYDCPKDFLDLVTGPGNAYSKEWREAVLARKQAV